MLILEGKIAIITGGARGIGRAIAFAFAQEGAKVAAFDIDPEDSILIEDLKKEIGSSADRYLYQKADVTNKREINQAVEETVKTFGRIDILVNNAGGGMKPVPLEDLEDKDWDQVVKPKKGLRLQPSHYQINEKARKRKNCKYFIPSRTKPE